MNRFGRFNARTGTAMLLLLTVVILAIWLNGRSSAISPVVRSAVNILSEAPAPHAMKASLVAPRVTSFPLYTSTSGNYPGAGNLLAAHYHSDGQVIAGETVWPLASDGTLNWASGYQVFLNEPGDITLLMNSAGATTLGMIASKHGWVVCSLAVEPTPGLSAAVLSDSSLVAKGRRMIARMEQGEARVLSRYSNTHGYTQPMAQCLAVRGKSPVGDLRAGK